MRKISPMTEWDKEQKRVICPVCRYERWVRFYDVYRLSHVTQIALVMLLVTSLFFPLLDTKIILIPVPILLIWEFFRNLLNRLRLLCPRCDFDPALYRVSRVKARERCEKRLLSLKDTGVQRPNPSAAEAPPASVRSAASTSTS